MSKRIVRILIEGMTDNAGGKETYIVNLFKSVDKEKYRFSFISYEKKIAYEDYLVEMGAEIINLPPRHQGILSFRKAIKELFENREFDVVWSHKTTLSSCEVLEFASKKNIPLCIVHSHSSSNMGGRLTYVLHRINQKRIKKWANEFFACSESAADWFYKNEKCLIVKNGIDVERFRFNSEKRNEIRKQLNIENQFVIGHVGRFGIEKNHAKLIDVFAEVVKRREDAVLVLCGDGEERECIERKVRDYGLQDHVLFLGVIGNVNEVLQAVDVFVMPSLFEGLPFALLEAQAAGLRCVVSDTVSRESDVLGRSVFVPLSSSNTEWAEKILLMDENSDRAVFADQMIKSGYNIADCSKAVTEVIDGYFETDENGVL